MLDSVRRAIATRQLTVLVTHWWEYFPGGRPDEAFISILHRTAEKLANDPDVRVVTFDDVAGIDEAKGINPHEAFMRSVPTADLSITLGLSITVLGACLYYNIKIKGLVGWVKELFTAPFHAHGPVAILLAPMNFLLNMIEFAAKTISHGMRLFGNMFAGELVFMLIALMGAVGFSSAGGIALWVGNVIAGSAWAIFHILIITLQAFVFMMLALVYLGQAHDAH